VTDIVVAPPDVADRVRGVLLGLAAGDALGTTLEFTRPGSFEPIEDMVGGGPFGLAPGQWTDDTSMAMCLAEALIEGGDDWPLDAMRRFVRWYRAGEWSSTGACFDIGNATHAALHRFERHGDPFAGSTDPDQAGNGSLMRVGPVALRWRGDWERAVEVAAASSRLTHATPEAVDACRYFVGLLVGALAGESRDRLLGGGPYEPVPGHWEGAGLVPGIARIAAGSFREKPASAIRASGYVVHTLEAALWATWHAGDFRAGALAAVNLGEDADTTGAVYGQLAGALFGASGIPVAWRERLALGERIEAVAARFA
jgi:ADP-ribosyl-[dinitrogen reductase] hydrolase